MWGTYDGGLAFIRNGGLVDGSPTEQDDVVTEMPGTPRPDTDQAPPRGRLPSLLAQLSASRHPPARKPSPATSDGSHSLSDNPSSSEPETGLSSSRTPPSSYPAEDAGEVKSIASRSRSPSPVPFEEHAKHPPLHFLFLGSSLGNFPRPDAVEFLKGLPLRPGSGDSLLLGELFRPARLDRRLMDIRTGLDHRNDGELVKLAYNDPQGYTRTFALNGLRVAERILEGKGDEVDRDYGQIFAKDGWEYENRWNEEDGSFSSLLAESIFHLTILISAARSP